MRSILKSRLGRASMIAVLTGIAALGATTSANAYDGYWHNHWRAHYYPHYQYYSGWYRPYYYAPPVVTYPRAYSYYTAPSYYTDPGYYYGPPAGLSFNLNVAP
jgi:hypothetical protein